MSPAPSASPSPQDRAAPTSLKALLFDKDGTLIDFDATWGPAAYEVMRALAGGDRAKLDALVRVSHYVEAERRFLPTSPLVAGSSAAYGPLWAQALGVPLTGAFLAEMDELFKHWGLRTLTPIADPAALAVELVARGYRLGIATNDAEGSARAQAEALGLTPHLDYVAGYDSGHGGKPDPGMVTAFVTQTGFAPREVAIVGDTLHDLNAGRAAGVVCIAVLSGPRRAGARAELAPVSDHVLDSIADLPALLDRLAAKAAPSFSPSA